MGGEVDTFNSLKKFLHHPSAPITMNLNFKNMCLQSNSEKEINQKEYRILFLIRNITLKEKKASFMKAGSDLYLN